jgi:uncharacterized protein
MPKRIATQHKLPKKNTMKERSASGLTAHAPLDAQGKPLRAHPELATRCTIFLQRLVSTTSGVNAALVVTSDGFEIASVLHSDLSPQKMAAMTSSMLALGEAILGEANLNDCQNVVIESNGGLIIMLSVGDPSRELLLSVVTNGQAMLGQVLWAARQCCAQVRQSVSPV